MTGIEATILRAQIRWPGHPGRKSHHRITKLVFCSELQQGARLREHPKALYRQPESQRDIYRNRYPLVGKPLLFLALTDDRPALMEKVSEDSRSQLSVSCKET